MTILSSFVIKICQGPNKCDVLKEELNSIPKLIFSSFEHCHHIKEFDIHSIIHTGLQE
jgi:hypothetical protein